MALKVLSVAHKELGYTEKASNQDLDSKTGNAGRGNWTKYARDLDLLGVYNFAKNGYDWCDIFVDWCFVEAYGLENMVKMLYQPLGGLGAGCTFSARYFSDRGKLFTQPLPGDQAFFYRGSESYHTGLVVAVDGNRMTLIEGNTSTGEVKKNTYDISACKYGRPDYSIVFERQDGEPFDPIQAEVDELPDWSRPTIQKLVDKGALRGDGESLNLTEDLTRTLVILDRMGMF